MPGNYEHYITKNIKEFYKRRLFAPIVYLLLLLILFFLFQQKADEEVLIAIGLLLIL